MACLLSGWWLRPRLCRGVAHEHLDMRLVLETVGTGETVAPVNERYPLAPAGKPSVGFVELCDIEGALFKEFAVGFAARGIVSAVGNEFVEIFAALVITHIDDNAPVRIDDAFGVFVLEPAEACEFARRGIRFGGIDFDDITGAIGQIQMNGYL